MTVSRPPTTLLGEWCATLLPWGHPTANPAGQRADAAPGVDAAGAGHERTVADRWRSPQPRAAHQAPAAFIDGELRQMHNERFASTANRSVVGIMNEFTHWPTPTGTPSPSLTLHPLSERLASTPCSPPYRRHTSPDLSFGRYCFDLVAVRRGQPSPICRGSNVKFRADEQARSCKSKARGRADRNPAGYRDVCLHRLWFLAGPERW
jgi:hypothetical protein